MRRLSAVVLCIVMVLQAVSCDAQDIFRTEPTDPDMTGVPVKMVNDFLVVGNTAYELYNFRENVADKYASTISKAASSAPSGVRVFDILVPTAIDVTLAKSVRNSQNTDDQKAAIDYIFSRIDPSVITVDTYDTLRLHRDEYLYFRTDHHYTSRGAWYAYTMYCDAAGIKPADLEKDFTQTMFQNYWGSFYINTDHYQGLDTPDYVVAYIPNATNSIKITQNDGTKLDWSVVEDVNGWDKTSLYNCFIGGDQPFSVITNDSVNDGSSCIVIKESYGNPFVPYLVPNYHTVYVVDYRHYNKISNKHLADVIAETGATDVIFINNMSMTRSDDLVGKLAKFVG
ncbi:DHHW protein [Ruminococcaceae bacterium YRB3002]|nr:DHHW protein [Ruminococcaceae bacterium YRB3002]